MMSENSRNTIVGDDKLVLSFFDIAFVSLLVDNTVSHPIATGDREQHIDAGDPVVADVGEGVAFL